MKRLQAIHRLETFLNKHDSPRIQMTLTVLVTALSGFVFTVLLYRIGIDTIWIRYVSAILFAYATFILLLAIRLNSRSSDSADLDPFNSLDLLPNDLSPLNAASIPKDTSELVAGGGNFGGGGASSSFGGAEGASSYDVGDGTADVAGASVEEPAVLVVAAVLIAAFAGLCVAFYMIYVAPSLYAELLLDGAVSAALVRRLKDVDRQHWLETAIKKTWFSVILLIINFGVGGWAMQYFVPEAKTLGQFISRILS